MVTKSNLLIPSKKHVIIRCGDSDPIKGKPPEGNPRIEEDVRIERAV